MKNLIRRTGMALGLAAALVGCSQREGSKPVTGLDLAVSFRYKSQEEVITLTESNVYKVEAGRFEPLNRKITNEELDAIQDGRNPYCSSERFSANWRNQFFVGHDGKFFPITDGNLLTGSDGLGYYDTPYKE